MNSYMYFDLFHRCHTECGHEQVDVCAWCKVHDNRNIGGRLMIIVTCL